jgi:hypothetical protein
MQPRNLRRAWRPRGIANASPSHANLRGSCPMALSSFGDCRCFAGIVKDGAAGGAASAVARNDVRQKPSPARKAMPQSRTDGAWDCERSTRIGLCRSRHARFLRRCKLGLLRPGLSCATGLDRRCSSSKTLDRSECPSRRVALWNLGFRPFYFLASVFAALSVVLWTCEYAGYRFRRFDLDAWVDQYKSRNGRPRSRGAMHHGTQT